MTPLLSVKSLNAWYGKSHVVQGVTFDVGPGELVALLGRNGAGKTSTLRAIMGLNRQIDGEILFAGADLAGWQPYRIARQGLSLVPEQRGIFATLSVRENLALAAMKHASWTVDAALDLFPTLKRRLDTPGGKLSGGEQQMLALIRALLAGPKLLILDEPTEGLSPVIVEHMANVLTMLKQAGMTMLLVEQNLWVCKQLADRFIIIDQGNLVWTGDRAALDGAEDVLARHLTLEHA